MADITRQNVGDELIQAIARQLIADRELCDSTPVWQTWTLDNETRDRIADGYVRWKPTAWFELTKTQANYVSIALKALAESDVVDAISYSPPRYYWVRLADLGLARLMELDSKLARKLSKPMKRIP